jgi:1,2-diacylglycerol 3-alpha-glucosyltransferase
MSLRVVVITEIIAPYRVPVFNALAQRPEIDLHVIFLAETDPTQRQWLVPIDQVHFSYQVLPSWRRRIHHRNVLLNWGIDTALRQADPDIIICGGYNYFASWMALRWAQRRQVPFLLWTESTTQDARSDFGFVEFLKTKFLAQCAGFVVPGKSAFAYVQNFGVNRDAIFVAPNAVDTAFFRSAAERARRNAEWNRKQLRLPPRYFLFVGRLVKEKGIFDLAEAYRRLTPEIRAEVGLVFVGDGKARTQLEQWSATVRPGCVQVAGFGQRDALAVYYALADALVFPTHTDPWGLVVNEAMACALPIISSDVAGCTADLVEDGRNGRVIRARNIDDLTAALSEIVRSAESRSVMGVYSENRIRQYSPEICANGMAKAALSCMEGRRA